MRIQNTPRSTPPKKKTVPGSPAAPHPLVGRFFHRIENGSLTWQGEVLAVIDDCALLQRYSWLMGEDCNQLMFPINLMKWSENPANGFQFYP